MLRITLAAARVNKGYTQKQASKELGVSNKTIANWEKGISFPDAKKIEQICMLYGVTIDNINFIPANNA